MKIQESAENYLETILILSQRQPYVRSIDIATELEFSKPSVSVAMKNLRQNDLIIMNEDGHITLTPSGLAIAAKMYERHTLISPHADEARGQRKNSGGRRLPYRACNQRGEL